MAGIGAEYSPKLHRLQELRRVFFVENESDIKLLEIWSRTLGVPFPSNYVPWQYLADHGERKKLFAQLAGEIQGLVGISLRDRDDESLGTTHNTLEDKSHPDAAHRNLYCRKWRRRYIEGYLLSGGALGRTCNRPVEEVVNHVRTHFAIDILTDYTLQEEPDAILDARAKAIISESTNSLANIYGIDKFKVAENMLPEEIPADVVIFLVELADKFR